MRIEKTIEVFADSKDCGRGFASSMDSDQAEFLDAAAERIQESYPQSVASPKHWLTGWLCQLRGPTPKSKRALQLLYIAGRYAARELSKHERDEARRSAGLA